MPAPIRHITAPSSPLVLQPNVEDIAPPPGSPEPGERPVEDDILHPIVAGTAAADSYEGTHPVRFDGPRRKRSFVIPCDLIDYAKEAQETSWWYGREYDSLNALVLAAIEREVDRIADIYNNGEPLQPYRGRYRQGRPSKQSQAA